MRRLPAVSFPGTPDSCSGSGCTLSGTLVIDNTAGTLSPPTLQYVIGLAKGGS